MLMMKDIPQFDLAFPCWRGVFNLSAMGTTLLFYYCIGHAFRKRTFKQVSRC